MSSGGKDQLEDRYDFGEGGGGGIESVSVRYGRGRVCWIHKPFLATTSASIIGHPSSRSMEDTALFPEEIPPVSPTRNILEQHRGEK